jgi:hypothetical protein
MCVDGNLLPFQSVQNFTPQLHEKNLEVCFLKDSAGVHGQAMIQITNYDNEPVVLDAGALLAQSDEPSHEEDEMAEYYEQLDIDINKPFDELFELDHLPNEVKEQVLTLLREFKDVFLLDDSAIPATPLLKFSVQVDPNAAPVVRAPYRVPQAHDHLMDEEINRMQRYDAIEDATPTTRWYSPVVLVVREKDGKTKARGCIDVRALNQHCLQDRWPLPRTWDQLHQIGAGQVPHQL